MSRDQSEDGMAQGLRQLLPEGHDKTIGFLIPANEMSQSLIDWYENEHSVNASFMWPHMRRYRRNYIMEVTLGPAPPYKVVCEFVWKSEEDKRRIVKLYSTDAANKTINEVLPSFIITPFPPGGFFLVPAKETEIARAHKAFLHDEPRARQIILLNCASGHPMDSFEQAVADYARLLADGIPGAALSVDFRRGGATVSAPADAVLFIDAASDVNLPPPENTVMERVNIFNVIALESPIKES